ncbi:sterol carrier protein 2 [Hymenopellis radicata]|nr:sterol carrier protein 2 [Hymenopellis radicata]
MSESKGRRVFIIGGGCTAFIKPRAKRTTEDMGLEAATKALLDAGITYDEVELASVGYCYGDSTAGQRALYALGLTSIPITNVNNNCSTGSTALFVASSAVRYGQASCALALGFEQMKPGSLGSNFPDRPSPIALLNKRSAEAEEALGGNHGPGTLRMFDNAAKEYFKKHGCGDAVDLARIASKNHKHSVNNPYSQFRDGWSVEQVMAGKQFTDQLTVYMCSPTSDGAACCIVADEAFVRKHGLENQAIEIVASADAMDVVGYGMSRACADKVFAEANASREDVGVVELHDCFASNELVTYDALRLCPDGGAVDMVRRGDNTYGGKYVINPSGGLEAKGHPLGATGLGMHFYITMQLRNWAGPMQAPGLFPPGNPAGSTGWRPEFWREGGEDGRERVGYNHAADVDKVKSRARASEYVLQAAKL